LLWQPLLDDSTSTMDGVIKGIPPPSQVDTLPEAVNQPEHPWVDRSSWPSFERWEYNVIFVELPKTEEVDSPDAEHKQNRKDVRTHIRNFLRLVAKAGMEYQLVRSPSNPLQLTAKIRANEEWYNKTATDLKLLYECKPIRREQPIDQENGVTAQTAEVKFVENFYQVFNAGDRELFLYHGMHNRFTSYRQQLLEYMLREREQDGGCEMQAYTRGQGKNRPKIIANAFPEHEDGMAKYLHSKWVMSWPWTQQPLEQIRVYLGEKIAFYFAWLDYFNKWLVAPAIIGAVFAVYLATIGTEQRNRSIIGVVYGAALVLWMTFFLEFWKRKSNYLAFKWGVLNYSEREVDRPEYDAPCERFNQYSLQMEKYYPTASRNRTMAFSQPSVFFMIAIVFTIMFFILMWKNSVLLFQHQASSPYLTYLPPVVNAIVIIIMGNIHKKVALKLNDLENYRTESEYEGALILKIFTFEFVNNFTSLFFIAFFGENKMDSLYFTLLIQLGVKQIVSNVMEIGSPIFHNKMQSRKMIKMQPEGKSFSWCDILVDNDPYDTFDDFKEIVIQFGYVLFFAAAFPGAAALALLNNIFEIRLDAFNILHNEPRPSAERGSGIGVWYQIIEIMSFVAIVTNALVGAITSESLGAVLYNFCTSTMREPIVNGRPSFARSQCDMFCQRVALSYDPTNFKSSPDLPTQAEINEVAMCNYNNAATINLGSGTGGPRAKYFSLNSDGPVTNAMWAMFIFEHLVVVLKFVLMAAVPDVPSTVEDAVRGHELYKDFKILESNPDDEEQPLPSARRHATEAATLIDFEQVPTDDRAWTPYEITDLFKARNTDVYLHNQNQALNTSNEDRV
jgi:hypothetical protein